MAPSLVINKELFIGRAKKIYDVWNTDSALSAVDALAFAVNNEKEPSYSKSNSLQTWLFNCSLMDTLLVMTKTGIYFLGSDRKVQFFAPLESKDKENLHPNVPPFITYKRNKSDSDRANFDTILDLLSKCKRVGHFVKDKPDTEFTKAWESAFKAKGELELVDVSLAFARLFAVKNADEVAVIKKSATASVNAWMYLRKKIYEIVNEDKKVRHNTLASGLTDVMGKVQLQGNLASENVIDECYSPIIQSGEQTSLKFSAESNDRILHCGTITSSIGARFASYCSNVGRTMMVLPSDGDKLMEELYDVTLNAELAVIEALKPGRPLSEAYEAGINYFKEHKPDYLQYLVKQNFGFATGIEFRESHLLISDKCKQTVEENMTFIVAVGLQNFTRKPTSKDSTKAASIFISDTVLVSASGPNEILTAKAKNFRSNIMRLKDKDDDDEIEEVVAEGRSKRSVVLQEQTRHKQTNEEKRQQKQRELAEKINIDAKERLAMQKGGDGVQKKAKSTVSYKSEDKFPDDDEVSSLMIHVDKRHDTVILPIFGVPVPFHISMIKNVSQVTEGDYFCIRINFMHPGSQMIRDSVQYPNPLAKFVKELSYKSPSVREHGQSNAPSVNLSTALRLIKEMQKRFRTLEAEEREKEGAVKQDKLIVSAGKANPKLKDLYVRPNIISKRISGSLEAHVNGFRYTSLRGDKIDVLYNNIKHAFFQQCDNEMIILLHFHLKNPVLWGKKKYGDVQFYAEVGEITTDLGKYHHMQDRDDIQSEQMEREMRKKLNLAFQNFCDKVERLTNQSIDFDTPFPELGFSGVPFRSSVLMKPTSSCLVHLTEWPPFVISLDEVELVHFERVTSNTRTFDLIIVFKDYRRKVQQIGQIPSSSLDNVKDWLNSCDIRYSEGPISLNWGTIMKTITEDPTEFFENGGWGFLHDQSSDEEREDESEESEFQASDDDESGSDEDEEESEASDSASEASLGSDESSGKDWSDLEEEATKADRAKERGEFEEADRKRKTGGGGGTSAKRRR